MKNQLRYIWPFGTGCGRLKLPALAFSISLLCSNSYCPLVRHIHVSHGKHPLASCVCPFTYMNPSLTGQIWEWRLLWSVKEIPIPLKSDENIGSIAWRPKYVRVDSSTKHFVAWQQCKGNPFLHFFGNTPQFYIVDSDICSPAVPSELTVAFPRQRLVTRMRHSVLLYIHCLSCYLVQVALNVSLNLISSLMHWKAIIW